MVVVQTQANNKQTLLAARCVVVEGRSRGTGSRLPVKRLFSLPKQENRGHSSAHFELSHAGVPARRYSCCYDRYSGVVI